MDISPYPRYGHPLAPQMLREILRVPTPGLERCQEQYLSELKGAVWDQHDPDACRRLANAVVRQVQRRLSNLPATVRGRHLPTLAHQPSIGELELEVRTFNCLLKAGLLSDLSKLNAVTINRLLEIPGFGAKSLVDLLTSVEFLVQRADPGQDLLRGKPQDTMCDIRRPRSRGVQALIQIKNSRYPRRGHRIAPLALTEVLRSTVSGPRIPGVRCLCDLDERIWKHCTHGACEKLASAVVEQVQASLYRLPGRLARRKMMACCGDMSGAALQLERRTHNCLHRAGLLKPSKRLEEATIGRLLRIRGFGAKSLVDLLTSLESTFGASGSVHAAVRSATQYRTKPDAELIAEVERFIKADWLKHIRPGASRFGDIRVLVGPGRGDATAIARRLAAGCTGLGDLKELTADLRRLYAKLSTGSQFSLKNELLELADAAGGDRGGRIFARRFGWEGGAPNILRVVATEFGLTRERVRQICDEIAEVFKENRPYAPVFDRMLAQLGEKLPAAAGKLESDEGMKADSEGTLRIETICQAARILGRKCSFVVKEVGSARVVLPVDTERYADLVLLTARKFVQHWGVTTIPDIIARLEEEEGEPIDADTVRTVLMLQGDFRWLDEPREWFWLSSVGKNSICNRIKKVVSVAGSIGVSELRSQISRPHRVRGFAPPRRVLLELCRNLPEYKVEGQRITDRKPIDWRDVLKDTEYTMVRVLKTHGSIIPSAEFEAACLRYGMKSTTFRTYLAYSPVVAKYAYCVYGLPGATVLPGEAAHLRPRDARQKRRVLLDHGWTHNGNIWIAYRLSEAIIKTGTCGLPGRLRQLVDGKYALLTIDGATMGTMVFKESNAWGLTRFFRRRGGEPEDCLLLLLDLKDRTATIQVGSADLVEDLRNARDEQPHSLPS